MRLLGDIVFSNWRDPWIKLYYRAVLVGVSLIRVAAEPTHVCQIVDETWDSSTRWVYIPQESGPTGRPVSLVKCRAHLSVLCLTLSFDISYLV